MSFPNTQTKVYSRGNIPVAPNISQNEHHHYYPNTQYVRTNDFSWKSFPQSRPFLYQQDRFEHPQNQQGYSVSPQYGQATSPQKKDFDCPRDYVTMPPYGCDRGPRNYIANPSCDWEGRDLRDFVAKPHCNCGFEHPQNQQGYSVSPQYEQATSPQKKDFDCPRDYVTMPPYGCDRSPRNYIANPSCDWEGRDLRDFVVKPHCSCIPNSEKRGLNPIYKTGQSGYPLDHPEPYSRNYGSNPYEQRTQGYQNFSNKNMTHCSC